MANKLVDKFFDLDGGTWKIINVGVTDERGTFVLAVHTTEGRQQKNGWYPRQTVVYIDPAIVRDDVAA